MIKKYTLLILIFNILIFTCSSSSTENIREPAVSGSFYTSDPKELTEQVNSYLNSVKKRVIQQDIIGLIVPHAGYGYSGQVAAYAYDQLKNREINTVIIMGPAHYYPLSYPSIYLKGKYKTPLGEVPINEKLAKKIKDQFSQIEFIPLAHKQEHSIEVQIPFLQVVLKNEFQIVPILLSAKNYKVFKKLSDVLFDVLKEEKNIMILASSDLSHFPDYKNANKVDNDTINLIKNFKTLELIQREKDVYNSKIANLQTYQCGLGPVTVLLELGKNFTKSSNIILDYKNSGDFLQMRKDRVVGYTAMAVVK